MMGRGEGYTCDPAAAPTTPDDGRGGTSGLKVSMDAVFDGWGYAHLYRNGSGKLKEVGKPYAVPEGIEERYAAGLRRPLDPRVRG